MQISFYFEKFRFASNEDANQFLFLKNLDLHLRKMQISFYFEKVAIVKFQGVKSKHPQILGCKIQTPLQFMG